MNVQNVIKRYFWVVGGLTVMTCAVFAAKATAHIVEAKFLGDPGEAPKVNAPAQRPDARKPAEPTRSKDGNQVAARNVFCSECLPAVVQPTDPGSIAITGLPLQLLATNVGATDKDSYATVVNTENQRQGSFSVGDKLPGASGPIKAIRYKYVDFQHNNRIERVMLVGAAPITTTVAVAETPKSDGDDDQAAIEAGIKKISDTQFEIDKALIDRVTANPMAFMKGARVVPAMKNGKPEGIKLYAIRPSSPYAKLGLTNGDTLMSVNGMQLDNVEKGLEMYQKLRSSTNLEVEVVRRGKPMTLKYTIK